MQSIARGVGGVAHSGRRTRVLGLLVGLVGLSFAVGAQAGDYGLVGWWKFDETTGTVATDTTGFGGNGTLMTMSGWTAAGKIKGCLTFTSASSDYVRVSDDADLRPWSELTAEAWVKPDTTAGYHCIVRKGGYGYWLGTNGGKVSVLISNAAANNWKVLLDGATTLNSANWTHLAVTYAGGVATVYVNGVADGSSAAATTEQIGYDYGTYPYMSIGGGDAYAPGQYFNGPIDDLRIYNKALSPKQIYRRYLAGDLKAQWRFDEGTGTVASDSGYFANTATMSFNSGGSNPTWTAGYSDDCVTYNPTTAAKNYLYCPSNPSLTIQSPGVTVAAWVKPDTSAGYHMIARKGVYGYMLGTNSGKVTWLVGKPGPAWNILKDGTTTLNSGNWTHLAATYDVSSGRATLYVNGASDGTTTGTASNIDADTNIFSIGSGNAYAPGQYFKGPIDEVSVYGRSLTPAEIGQLYDYGMDLAEVQTNRARYDAVYANGTYQADWNYLASNVEADDKYTFSYVLDATTCLFEATQDRVYLDRSMRWAESMRAAAASSIDYAGWRNWQNVAKNYSNAAWAPAGQLIGYLLSETQAAVPMMRLAVLVKQDPGLSAAVGSGTTTTYGTRAGVIYSFCRNDIMTKWLYGTRNQLPGIFSWIEAKGAANEYTHAYMDKYMFQADLLNHVYEIEHQAGDLTNLQRLATNFGNRVYNVSGSIWSWDKNLTQEGGYGYTAWDTSHADRGPYFAYDLYRHGQGNITNQKMVGLARVFTDVIKKTDGNGKPEFTNFINGSNVTFDPQSRGPYANGMIYNGFTVLGEFDSTAHDVCDDTLAAILGGFTNPSLTYNASSYGQAELAAHLAKDAAAR